MPYITKERARTIREAYLGDIETKGELNYAITTLLVEYLVNNGKSYQTISDVVAAAQDAADEMKRRVLAPYEDDKRSDPTNIDPYMDL